MAKKASAKKAPAKKAPAKRATKAKTVEPISGNLATLTTAGVVPAGYKRFSPAEKEAIQSLSESEVTAIVATKTKMGKKFFPKHASHGMYY
jgi:hypothetical protein